MQWQDRLIRLALSANEPMILLGSGSTKGPTEVSFGSIVAESPIRNMSVRHPIADMRADIAGRRLGPIAEFHRRQAQKCAFLAVGIKSPCYSHNHQR